MNRRAFLYNLGLGLAAGWIAGPLSWPRWVEASTPRLSLAFLADAHLPDGNPSRAEAQALVRAVAEIKALAARPRLVLFAGDLAHDGHPAALALGQEILSELPLPVLAVRGEGDGRASRSEAGGKFFQERFVYSCAGVNLLGLDTVWQDTPAGPAFALGESQYRWLNRVLSGLDPAAPLIVLTHAPLEPVFRPWGQWTVDSGPLLHQLSRFRKVLCLHGHVHHGLPTGGYLEVGRFALYRKPKTENRKPITHLALPATSWPLPEAMTGTPRKLRPGLGPRGCGWVLLDPRGPLPRFYQVAWQA